MNATSKIQIIKVGAVVPKTFEGRSYEIQEAECITLNDDGSVNEVAVLRLGENMRGDKAPKVGTYTASFSLRANPKDRRLGAVLMGLVAIPSAKV
ncbi:MAG TPA: hypothetical protein VJ809_17380 [Pirellulales bacterium]|nr:hypothetical protein [Pirellulales bacterium]